VAFQGKITQPRNFEDFDYEAYLKRFGVQALVRSPKNFTTLSSQTGGNVFLRNAKKVRDFLAHNLEKSLPMPHAQIAMGILLGVKNQLPPATGQDFKNSGLQHLLVVSGSNVSIVIIFITFFLKKFGRQAIFLGVVPALIFFIAMTGADPPILRAGIMGGMVAFAASMGRLSETRNLVLFSAVIMGIWNPRIIQNDIGFFLSTFATMGIILGVPVLYRILGFLPEKFGLRMLLTVSLAAQIAVLPILGYHFGTFPMVGVIANLFSEPLVPLGMGASFSSALTGILPEPMAKVLAIPAYCILEMLLQIAHFFGKVPPLSISKNFSILCAYGVVGFFFYGSFARNFAQKYLHRFSEEIDAPPKKNTMFSE
jgi:competence protein ComEC